MKLKMTNIFCLSILIASCNSHESQVPVSAPFRVAEKEVQSIEKQDKEVAAPLESKKMIQSSIVKKRLVEFNSNFSNFEEFKKGLNQYVVHAEVGNNESELELMCETQSPNTEKKLFKKKFLKAETNADLQIDMRGRFEQVEGVSCKIKDNEKILEEIHFTLKKDILIQGTQDYRQVNLISGKNEIGALVFDDRALLLTFGDNLNIMAEELMSQHAAIMTYAENEIVKAGPNQNGRSGGILNINTLKAYGTFLIKMKGQQGGDQTLVPARVAEVPAVDYLLDASNVKHPELPPFCTGDAAKGYKGYKGKKGYEGKRGGNSGIAMVNVGDGTDFKLEMGLIPGAGGFGGAPGLGGEGSIGGKGKGENNDYLCPMKIISQDGPHGDVGDLGDVGDAGQDGARERGYYFDAKNNLRIEF